MSDMASLIVMARRSRYAGLLAAWLSASAAACGALGATPGQTLALVLAGLTGTAGTIAALWRLATPPEVRIAPERLELRIGAYRRTWPWLDICDIALIRRKRGRAIVTLSAHVPGRGGRQRLRRIRLDFPFRMPAYLLHSYLQVARAERMRLIRTSIGSLGRKRPPKATA